MARLTKRYELSDEQWDKIKDFLPGRKETRGVTAKDNRLFVNGVLWILRSGARWMDLPTRYGKWKSVHKRFTRWASKHIWENIFKILIRDSKNEYIMIDSTIVKAHQHASRAKKKTLRLWGVPEEE
jgi:transposase